MEDLHISPLGVVRATDEGMAIIVDEAYIPALQALDGFSHLQVIWWFSDFDTDEARQVLEVPQPYQGAPEIMGVFATRAPVRPNPIALSTSEVIDVDYGNGIIRVAYIDAHDGSPVLDIKPYTPSMDRVDSPTVPAWCAHWPLSLEASEGFDWENVFTY